MRTRIFRSSLVDARRAVDHLSTKLSDPELARLLKELNDMPGLKQKMDDVRADLHGLSHPLAAVNISALQTVVAIPPVTQWIDERYGRTALNDEVPPLKALSDQTEKMLNAIPLLESGWLALERKLISDDIKQRLAMAAELPRLLQELADIQKESAKLPAEIEAANTAAVTAEAAVRVPFIPADSSVRPVWVECHRAGLTVYGINSGKATQFDVPLADIETNADLRSVAQHAAADASRNGSEVLDLLVRPDGVKAYNKIMSVVEKTKAPYSKTPITVAGKLQFQELSNP